MGAEIRLLNSLHGSGYTSLVPGFDCDLSELILWADEKTSAPVLDGFEEPCEFGLNQGTRQGKGMERVGARVKIFRQEMDRRF